MFDPSKEYGTWNYQFGLTKGDMFGLLDAIRDFFDDRGIEVNCSEVRGVNIIEDRKRRGF
jgi:hypothetical protein